MRVKLTPKQTEVLYYLAQACSNQQIADKMGISVATVKLHLVGFVPKTGCPHKDKSPDKSASVGAGSVKTAEKTSGNPRKRLIPRLRFADFTTRYFHE